MRVLLSTIGSRGDVQPLVALAVELKAMGHQVRMCAPPDFREWLEQLDIPLTPIGPEVRSTARVAPPSATATTITPERRRHMLEATVATQFETVTTAADGCDIIVGATALQVAAPSVAARMGIPYVFVAYSPNVLPSPLHAPPVLPMLGDTPAPLASDYSELWAADARRWNDTWEPLLNAQRASLGLQSIDDVRRYVHTDRPWLAADPALAPWPHAADDTVFQTGAWILPDERPLPREVETFLEAGEPPIYFGSGSMRASENLSRVMIESARALGRRAIVSRGWADLALVDDAPDCLSIGDVNHQALFTRVAAVVHHGGAGTTTAAAQAGAPQVVLPRHYDQPFWAQRVQQLGIGTAHDGASPTTVSLSGALEHSLARDVALRAASTAAAIRRDGARIAAERLTESSASTAGPPS